MTKKKNKKLFCFFNDNFIKDFSFVLLLLWVISPLVEYIFKNHFKTLYTHYFSDITYAIGSLGIIIYIIKFIKDNKGKEIKYKKYIPEILILLLLILGVNSSLLSNNPHLSFFGETYRKEGLIVYFMYTGVLLLSSTFDDRKYLKYFFQSIVIVCLIITIIPLFRNDFTYVKFCNVFHNLNHYGYYLMINVMISLFMFINDDRKIIKFIYLVSYIFLLYLLIRNNTFGSYLAILISLISLFIYSMITKYKRLCVIIVLIIFASTSFMVSKYDIKIGERVNFKNTSGMVSKNFSNFSRDIKGFINHDEKIMDKAGTNRGKLWRATWKYTLEHPFVGGGMECLIEYYIRYGIKTSKKYNFRPHNIILQISSFIGIPGAIIYISLIIYLAFSNLKIMKNDRIHIMIYFTAMSYFISSMFGNSMYYTSPYYMILLGLLIGLNKFRNIKDQQK